MLFIITIKSVCQHFRIVFNWLINMYETRWQPWLACISTCNHAFYCRRRL